MPGINFNEFQRISQSKTEGIIRPDSSRQDGLKLEEVAFGKFLVRVPTQKEQQANQRIRQAFMNAVQENYSGFFAMDFAQNFAPEGTTPLNKRYVAQVLKRGVEFRFLATDQRNKTLVEFFPTGENKPLNEKESPSSFFHSLICQEAKTEQWPSAQSQELLRKHIIEQIQSIPENVMVTRSSIRQMARKAAKEYFSNGELVQLHKPMDTGKYLKSDQIPNLVPAQKKSTFDSKISNMLSQLVPGGRKKLSLSSLAFWKKKETPLSYFQKVGTGVPSQYREYNVNFSVMRHFIDKLPTNSPLRPALIQRTLGYLNKFGNVTNSPQLGWQANQISDQDDAHYHRSDDQLVWTMCYRQALAKHLNLNEYTIMPVNSRKIMNVVKREFGLQYDQKKVIELTPDNMPSVMQKVAQNIQRGDGMFFLDVSHIFDQVNVDGISDEIPKIRQNIHDRFLNEAKIFVEQKYADETDIGEKEKLQEAEELTKTMLENVAFGGIAQVGEQPFLFMFAADQKHQGLPFYQIEGVRAFNGFTPGPGQLLETWAKLNPDLDQIIGHIEQGPNKLTPNTGKAFFPDSSGLISFNSYSDFLQHQTVQNFSGLWKGLEGGSPPFHLLSNITMKLLEGLNDKSVYEKFARADVPGLLQYSLNRITAFMAQAVKNKDNMKAFINDIHLIHEEIATILAIAQPYDITKFQELMSQCTDILPSDFPEGIKPIFEMKNSGMNAFESILSGVESLTGKKDINVVFLEGTYYEESDHVLNRSPFMKKNVFSGDEHEQSIRSIQDNLKQGEKLDLFVAEFHHNISTHKDRYQPENVISHVKSLLESDLVSDKFTIAIDTTIARTDAPEIKEFLNTFKDEISSGKINVVLFRSGQKFDMAGIDHFNGGFSVTFNKSDAYQEYFSGTRKFHDEIPTSKSNMQGMIHFQQCAQKELNQYRQLIMDNHRNLLNPDHTAGLPQSMLTGGIQSTSKPFLQIASSIDTGTVFLDLRSPLHQKGESNKIYGELHNRLEKMALSLGLPISKRPSFGYPHANITPIGALKLRLTLGLESETDLIKYRDMLVTMQTVGTRMQELYPNDTNKARSLFLSNKADSLFDVYYGMTKGTKKETNLSSKDRITLAKHWLDSGFSKPAKALLDQLQKENLVETDTLALKGALTQYLEFISMPGSDEDINTALEMHKAISERSLDLSIPSKTMGRIEANLSMRLLKTGEPNLEESFKMLKSSERRLISPGDQELLTNAWSLYAESAEGLNKNEEFFQATTHLQGDRFMQQSISIAKFLEKIAKKEPNKNGHLLLAAENCLWNYLETGQPNTGKRRGILNQLNSLSKTYISIDSYIEMGEMAKMIIKNKAKLNLPDSDILRLQNSQAELLVKSNKLGYAATVLSDMNRTMTGKEVEGSIKQAFNNTFEKIFNSLLGGTEREKEQVGILFESMKSNLIDPDKYQTQLV